MIEQDVYLLLKESVSEVEGRVYPLRMPQNCLKPALVYQVISDVTVPKMSGWCDDNRSKKRMQISVFTKSYETQKNIEASIKTALKSFENEVKEITNRDLFEDETGLYHGLIEFKSNLT